MRLQTVTWLIPVHAFATYRVMEQSDDANTLCVKHTLKNYMARSELLRRGDCT